jgi:O-antigen/teichoic acid export membrane protein
MTELSNEGIGKLKGVLRLSFIYKGINVLLSFLLIRYTIQYAGEEVYGLWVTILAFLSWFSVIESGVSNSLRNQITAYFSERNYEAIKRHIAMAYKSLSIIYVSMAIIFVIIIIATPFHTLFQSDQIIDTQFALSISVIIYFLYFILHYLNNVLLATHQAEKTYLFLLFQNAAVLLCLLILNQSSVEANLTLICLIYTLCPLLIWITLNLFSYSKFLKKIRPTIFHFKETKSPFKELNPSFFVLQLFTLLIYSTDNIIILNYMNGVEVAKYNVTFKYFNIITVLFNLVLVPYWAIFSEAYYKKDIQFITYSIRRLLKNWGAVLVVTIFLVIISPFAYSLWIGKSMDIPIVLSILMAISALLTAWYNIFGFYLKSSNQLVLQTKLLTIAGLINIPLSIFLIPYFQSTGVIVATIISILPLAIALPWQYKQSLKKLGE